MSLRLEITASAIEDLLEIVDYLSIHNPQAAANFMTSINDRFELLTQQPYLGRARNDILLNLRCLVFRDYLIFYLPSDDQLEIWHVLHGSRDNVKNIQRYFDSLSH